MRNIVGKTIRLGAARRCSRRPGRRAPMCATVSRPGGPAISRPRSPNGSRSPMPATRMRCSISARPISSATAFPGYRTRRTAVPRCRRSRSSARRGQLWTPALPARQPRRGDALSDARRKSRRRARPVYLRHRSVQRRLCSARLGPRLCDDDPRSRFGRAASGRQPRTARRIHSDRTARRGRAPRRSARGERGKRRHRDRGAAGIGRPAADTCAASRRQPADPAGSHRRSAPYEPASAARADTASAPVPTPPPSPAAPPAVRPTPGPAPAVAASGDWRVQLGSFSDRARAERHWRTISARVSELAGLQPYLVSAGPYTRLQAGPFRTEADASRVCAAARRSGSDCITARRQ